MDAKPLMANVHPDMVPTDADRFWFNLCRTAFGSVVLGLTALFTIFTIQPLFMEPAMAGPPPPPTPAQPFTLWSDEDSHAAWSILLISSGQALLIGAISACCWLRKHKRLAAALDAAAAKELRRAKKVAKKALTKRTKAEGHSSEHTAAEDPARDASPAQEAVLDDDGSERAGAPS